MLYGSESIAELSDRCATRRTRAQRNRFWVGAALASFALIGAVIALGPSIHTLLR